MGAICNLAVRDTGRSVWHRIQHGFLVQYGVWPIVLVCVYMAHGLEAPIGICTGAILRMASPAPDFYRHIGTIAFFPSGRDSGFFPCSGGRKTRQHGGSAVGLRGRNDYPPVWRGDVPFPNCVRLEEKLRQTAAGGHGGSSIDVCGLFPLGHEHIGCTLFGAIAGFYCLYQDGPGGCPRRSGIFFPKALCCLRFFVGRLLAANPTRQRRAIYSGCCARLSAGTAVYGDHTGTLLV